MRAAVPLTFERYLHRAIFRQTRAYSALLAFGETVASLSLEPHETLRSATLDGQPIGATSLGRTVIISPAATGGTNSILRVEYTAGWAQENLPADLKDALLFAVMERFVRRNENLTQSETVPLPQRPSVDGYRVFPDPVRRRIQTINLAAD